jgi:type I restriction enzyme M protein
MAVRTEREQLKAQLNELEAEMSKYLEELGYGA